MNNRVANLKKMCDIMGVQVGRAKRVLARTEDYFNIDLKYNIEEARAFCEVNGYDVMDIVERVNEVMQITRPILAACVYIGSSLSSRKVAELFYTSDKSVRRYTKKIEELI
jgi:pyruvate-formate lyase-activating enzyme